MMHVTSRAIRRLESAPHMNRPEKNWRILGAFVKNPVFSRGHNTKLRRRTTRVFADARQVTIDGQIDIAVADLGCDE